MENINSIFKNSQLSLASYADLTKDPLADQKEKLKLEGSGMSDSQATQFASQYSVVAVYPNTVTGFSATVFKENGTDELTVAIRGTEGAWSFDLWWADFQIFKDGAINKGHP